MMVLGNILANDQNLTSIFQLYGMCCFTNPEDMAVKVFFSYFPTLDFTRIGKALVKFAGSQLPVIFMHNGQDVLTDELIDLIAEHTCAVTIDR